MECDIHVYYIIVRNRNSIPCLKSNVYTTYIIHNSRVYTCIYIYMYIYICMYVCIYVCMYVYVYVYTRKNYTLTHIFYITHAVSSS